MRRQLISIIVPVYNCKEYLSNCINSLINQSYTKIEIIIIDDGSNDGTSEICDEWQKKDSRIKVIHTNNFGVSHARNIGLDNMSGSYVGFVDADDWVDTDTYELLLREMIEKNAEVSGGGYICNDVRGDKIIFCKRKSKVYSRDEILQEIFSPREPRLLCWELCDKLFKRDLINNVRFNESIGTAEDMLFFWQMMKRVHRFAYSPLFKYHYRMRSGSAVHSGISPKTISSLYAVREIMNSARTENDDLKYIIWKQYVRYLVGCTRQMLVYDAKKYEEDILMNQKEIRREIGRVIRLDNLSIRFVLGVFFLCFPIAICRALTCFIKKRND
ncbi:Glycosyltransferase involved in cell wall bisynthesis [Selenomonas ruminantium]|uniref:Glycosyltransferase involved in cell wall bisynthesis n=1 Tax=Selenomonas ruminantium TaxID=971 RepID=A0A1I3BZ03_SELRU|nr:glycosyltransferase family 2 protein [Selenomonas ruminantium]SFH67159.1 Glycosyltransferase involved in cell wall bisynthesis [Selenomonas ruminantium]